MARRQGDDLTPAARRLLPARAVTSPLPSAGLPFRDAMVWCGHTGTVAEFQKLNLRTILPRGTVGALTDGEWSALDAWRDALERSQLTRLRYGYQRATAFQPGSLEAVPVPAGWWEGASVDLVANTATAHGTTLLGLLIYAGEEQPMTAEPPLEPAQEQLAAAAAPEMIRRPEPEAESDNALKPRKRGRRAVKQPAVEKQIRDEIAGGCSLEDIGELSDKQRQARYDASPDTVKKALTAVARSPGNSR